MSCIEQVADLKLPCIASVPLASPRGDQGGTERTAVSTSSASPENPPCLSHMSPSPVDDIQAQCVTTLLCSQLGINHQ